MPTENSAKTFADVLDGVSRKNRGLTFTANDSRFLSFADLRNRTAELAARWAGLGVRHGDRVVLVVADECEFAGLFLAALSAGVVATPVYPPYRMGQMEGYLADLRGICRTVGARCCVVSAPLRDLADRADLACPVHTHDDLLSARPGPVRRPAAGDIAFLQFSSGSTGSPRAVSVSHRALLANARAIRSRLRTDGDRDRAVSWLPMYHDMGLVGFLLVPLLDQVSTWYLPPLRFGRDPLSWLRLMSAVGGTIAFAPNFAYGLVTRHASDRDRLMDLDLSGWRVAGCGAEPVHAATLRAFATGFAGCGFRGTAFMPSYGLAESTLAVALTPCGTGLSTLTVDAGVLAEQRRAVPPRPGGTAAELVSCGTPVDGTQVRVRGGDGRWCADGEEGELVVRGPSLADGYFGDPASTADTWRDGWLHTGDYGLLHDGRVFVTGRLKDLIVVNGINYHPQHIERAAASVAGVRPGHVAALPVRDGHTEGVRLVVASSGAVETGELTERVRRAVVRDVGLSPADVVVIRGDLPKTSSGKLRRTRTAALLADGTLTGTVPG